MTCLTLCFLLLKCQMIVCPSPLHFAFKGLISPPSEPPGEIMSFGVSPVNYSDSEELHLPYFMFCLETFKLLDRPLRERGGVVVERRTPNREVLGSNPTSVTVLCP